MEDPVGAIRPAEMHGRRLPPRPGEIECTGQIFSQEDYPELYAIIENKFAGSEAHAPDEFVLPNAPGYYLKAKRMEDTCINCGSKIETMAFRGTGVCSEDCKKVVKGDVSSVGTFMFVTTDEAAKIREGRNGQ